MPIWQPRLCEDDRLRGRIAFYIFQTSYSTIIILKLVTGSRERLMPRSVVLILVTLDMMQWLLSLLSSSKPPTSPTPPPSTARGKHLARLCPALSLLLETWCSESMAFFLPRKRVVLCGMGRNISQGQAGPSGSCLCPVGGGRTWYFLRNQEHQQQPWFSLPYWCLFRDLEPETGWSLSPLLFCSLIPWHSPSGAHDSCTSVISADFNRPRLHSFSPLALWCGRAHFLEPHHP